MSRQADEKRYNGKSLSKDSKKKQTGLKTFSPQKQQREAIRNMDESLGDVLKFLGERVSVGFKLSLGYSENSNAFFLILREEIENWMEARGVSFWHADVETCFFGLYYYLTTVAPAWPNEPGQVEVEEYTW